MADDTEFSKGFIKGYREGLLEAWEELAKLAAKGYSPKELQIMIKSSKPMLDDKVTEKVAQIEKTMGRKIFSEETMLKSPSSGVSLYPGMSILFREDRPEKGPAMVRSLFDGGSKILSISRMHPDQLIDRYKIKGEMIWLTKSEYSSAEESESKIEFISPNSLPVLAEAIQQFLGRQSAGVIFLEGLEYMVSQNDPKSVLRFIQLINEQVLLRKGYLILSANPIAMDQRDFSLIEREMTQVN